MSLDRPRIGGKAPARDRKIGGTGILSEQRVAKRLQGRLTPASGALGAKGDMTAEDYRLECKSTVNESMSVKLSWLEKITREAHATGKKPALTVTFTTGDGRPRRFGSWVMVDEQTWNDMIKGRPE